MNQLIKNHLKKQRSNYIILVITLLFSTYFSTINTCNENSELINKKFESLKVEVLNQRLFMKKILQSSYLSQSERNDLQKNLEKVSNSSITHKEFIDITSDWASTFSSYLSLHEMKSTQLISEHAAYTRLISLGVRYNIDLDNHLLFSNQFLSKTLCSKSLDPTTFSRLSNSNFSTSNFLIVL